MHRGNYSTVKIIINGIVQGVGFRPFVYQLAKHYNLKGYVINDSHGVEIEVSGQQETLEEFIKAITEKKPTLAHITSVRTEKVFLKNYHDFKIKSSQNKDSRTALISPDVGICNDCLKEMFTLTDRRYRYPFINCTNCGPRFTIIKDIPYDRPFTTMAKFKMCDDCQHEYDNPTDRRFHAQPNACWKCGPMVTLYNNSGEKIITKTPIIDAANLLKQGYIIAIKGLGGFHLAADATNQSAIKKLRERKHRDEKPFAVMSFSIADMEKYLLLDDVKKELLQTQKAPIVLCEKVLPSNIAKDVAPNNRYIGVMLPYTPLHYLLLNEGFTALVMTSGNISNEPIVISNENAFKKLGKIADFFLIHNRDILCRVDDSVQQIINSKPSMIRRSRGYAPFPIQINQKLPNILACGPELKNTICLTRENQAFVSQHIGDLQNLSSFQFFKQTINYLKKIFAIKPVAIAYDLHPNYMASQYALKEKQIRTIGVQHHFAHIVSCMAENQLDGEVIGIALDGTGYGLDRNIWGGEILIVTKSKFRRLGHIEYIPMPGGEGCILNPWRMALSYLYYVYKDELWQLDIDLLKKIRKEDIEKILEIIKSNINSPLTSSCGRLFEAISALLNIQHCNNFEGQAAINLEMKAWEDSHQHSYNIDIEQKNNIYILKVSNLIKEIVHDIESKKTAKFISHKFHNFLVNAIAQYCKIMYNKFNLKKVVLSGGVFQNKLLTEKLTKSLKEENFEVYTHEILPPNDGCISLGQAVIAGNIILSEN